MKTKFTILAAAALTGIVLLLCSCSTGTFRRDEPSGAKTEAKFTAPAWPWQDSTKAFAKLSQMAKTNSYSLGLSGYSESETTSTNAVNLIGNVVGAAVGAAVKAAK